MNRCPASTPETLSLPKVRRLGTACRRNKILLEAMLRTRSFPRVFFFRGHCEFLKAGYGNPTFLELVICLVVGWKANIITYFFVVVVVVAAVVVVVVVVVGGGGGGGGLMLSVSRFFYHQLSVRTSFPFQCCPIILVVTSGHVKPHVNPFQKSQVKQKTTQFLGLTSKISS